LPGLVISIVTFVVKIEFAGLKTVISSRIDCPRYPVDGAESSKVGLGVAVPVTVRDAGEPVDPAS
jgi:hypothetical protein